MTKKTEEFITSHLIKYRNVGLGPKLKLHIKSNQKKLIDDLAKLGYNVKIIRHEHPMNTKLRTPRTINYTLELI